MTMSLGEKQRLFTKLVADLIKYIYAEGYEASFGEAYRTPEQAELNAKKGTGIRNSLHTKRLAIDLNLFFEDVYQPHSESYEFAGSFWEKLHPDCRWGGRFKKPDGNHFSLTFEGIS